MRYLRAHKKPSLSLNFSLGIHFNICNVLRVLYEMNLVLIEFIITLGVVQLLNKMDGKPFNQNDENLFEVSKSYSFFLARDRENI